MKLIDIEDEMLLKNLFEGGRSAKQVTKLFMKQPVIEAIPIDFLIKTQEEYCKRYGEVYKSVVLNLVEDWRKDNEREKKISNIV